ncbi:MAG TPA: FeoA family protein [Verrucomicrobiae bacterium]
MKQESVFVILEGQCAGPAVCPLSRIKPGTTVAIKGLATDPAVRDRLRELGFCEQQQIKLVSRDSNYICQVCNARLGISRKLADSILVETVAKAQPPARRAKSSEPASATVRG